MSFERCPIHGTVENHRNGIPVDLSAPTKVVVFQWPHSHKAAPCGPIQSSGLIDTGPATIAAM